MNLDDALGKDIPKDMFLCKSCNDFGHLLHTGVITKVPRASPSFPAKSDMAIEAGRFGFGQIKKAVLEAKVYEKALWY